MHIPTTEHKNEKIEGIYDEINEVQHQKGRD